MSTINQFEAEDTLSAAHLMAMFDQSHGDARQITLAQLLSYLSDGVEVGIGRSYLTKQYERPMVTGWSVDVDNTGGNIWLTIDPDAGYAAGTIVLPADPINNQQIWFRVTQLVTTLTFDMNGHSGWAGPGAITVTSLVYRMKYDLSSDSWYWA